MDVAIQIPRKIFIDGIWTRDCLLERGSSTMFEIQLLAIDGKLAEHKEIYCG